MTKDQKACMKMNNNTVTYIYSIVYRYNMLQEEKSKCGCIQYNDGTGWLCLPCEKHDWNKPEMISTEDALGYVLENHYDEVREAVFEQEGKNRHE